MAIDVVWKSDATISGMLSDKAGIFYFLPLLIFSISDPLAAIVGKKWPIGKYTLLKDSKTLVGSGAFLISSFGISLLFMVHQDFSIILSISIAFAVSLATTIAEGISQKGLDNLFIPVSAIFILALFF